MTTHTQQPLGRFHYGWVIMVVSMLTVLGALGCARFGYTMILPDMQAALSLSNTQTGVLAAGNFLGYLALASVGGVIASRYGPRRIIAISMTLIGVTMVLTGLAGGFQEALLWRVLTGVGSGGSNVPVMALLPAWFAARRRGLATGVAVAGSSLALILTGLLVPRILDSYGMDGWRYSWAILGALVLLLGFLAAVLLRNRPEDMGLRPVASSTDVPAMTVKKASAALGWGQVYRSAAVWRLAFVYIAFGFSYIIYVTYFAKYLQAEARYTKEAAGNLWAAVGWISIFCGLIWGTVSDQIGRKYGLALVYLLQAIAFALFALWRDPIGYTISAVLFGLTAWSIPGIVAAACGDYVGGQMAPAALGFATLFFGLGQASGPLVAGVLKDATRSFAPAFLLAAGVALLGGIGSLLLRPPRTVAE
ncbi:MAG: MFS transporter [Anaerolineae bacterium]